MTENDLMESVRRWNAGPYRVAILHGGPGAAGEMAPVARALSVSRGVLEPFQTERTVGGQVQELADVLRGPGEPPYTIIGFSWGAFLGYLLAARHPSMVRKLVLVGSPPFEESFAATIRTTRLGRLGQQEREEACRLERQILDTGGGDDAALSRYGAIMERADAYDPVDPDEPAVRIRHDIFRDVWSEAEGMRRSGALLAEGTAIRCPVVAIHGDYDPHPAEGVRDPLARMLPDFRFVLLDRCGHRPWTERHAREQFYSVLEQELDEKGRD